MSVSVSRNNNPAATIIGIVIGVLFLLGILTFMTSLGIFILYPMFFITIFIGLLVSIISKSRRPYNNNSYKVENQVNVQKPNPYRVQNSQEQVKSSLHQRFQEELKLKITIRFCQFCGSKIDRDALFCHSCGSKLE
jgi:hypothetical protein